MNKLGLVFSGGGGKGAYEIGVWKYLKKIGLDKYVQVVSGTSVGALNTVLFGLGDVDKAELIWCQEIKYKILSAHEIWYYLKLFIDSIRYGDINLLGIFISTFHNLIKDGIFTRDGLTEIIKKYVDINNINTSKINLYAACTYLPPVTNNQLLDIIAAKFSNSSTKYFKLNNENYNTLLDILLSSSAIPGIFPSEKINGNSYYDGGLKDNVPSKPLSDENCTHAIIVHLDYHKKPKPNPKISENIPKVIHIFPSKDLGNLFKGTLNFSPEGVKARIALGESDAEIYHLCLLDFLKDFKCV